MKYNNNSAGNYDSQAMLALLDKLEAIEDYWEKFEDRELIFQ